MSKYNALKIALKQYSEKSYPLYFEDFTYLGCEYVNNKDEKHSCICGKTNIKYLHSFKSEYNNDEFILGSSCVEELLYNIKEDYDEYTLQFQLLINHLEEKVKKAKDKSKNQQYCLICDNVKIRNCNYEDKNRKIFCKECYNKYSKTVKCITCKKSIKIEKDYYGNVKKLCKGCWCKSKNYKPKKQKLFMYN